MAKEDAPLAVKIPSASDDRAISSKVGIIAVVGFAVGVAWPRLLHVKVGPTPPESESKAAAASDSAKPKASASAVAAPSSSAPDMTDLGTDLPKVTNKETIVVAPGVVTSCVNKKKENIADCGTFNFDKYVNDKLIGIGDCAYAIGQEGDFSLQLNVSFDEKKPAITVSEGKSKSTFGTMAARGLLKCAADGLKTVELEKIPHTHNFYSVEYKLTFYPPGKSPDTADSSAKPDASGEPGDPKDLGHAVVTIAKAIVRDKPEREKGKVLARLPQGTHVKILSQEKDWYEIESGKTKGWVHRQAIGK